MTCHADFEWRVHPDLKMVLIIDLDRGNRSVTNDVENVIATITNMTGPLNDSYVVYRDSQHQWDEIIVKDDKFVGFKSGQPLDYVTLWIESAKVRAGSLSTKAPETCNLIN